MIGRFNHVATAVPDLEAVAKQYRDTLRAKLSEPQPVPEHGVTEPCRGCRSIGGSKRPADTLG